MRSADPDSTIELVQRSLARAQKYSDWNSLSWLNTAQLLDPAQPQAQQATGLLAGIPVVIKDNIDWAGVPTTGATPALQHHIPRVDAPVVQRLRRAGALLLAKTNMHELAFGVSGVNQNPALGTVPNAHSIKHLAGGSSSGTAVAIALGIAPFGLGSDTGGSIRIPAALNGIAGLRPTQSPCSHYGAVYSTQSCLPVAPSVDTIGPMASTLSDLVWFDGRLQGHVLKPSMPELEHLRIGLPRPLWADLDPQLERVCLQACQRLREQGVEFVDIDIPDMLSLARTALFDICMYEAGPAISAYLREHNGECAVSLQALAAQIASPDVRDVFKDYVLPGGSVHAWQQARLMRQPLLRSRYLSCLRDQQLDALCYPAVPVLAPLLECAQTMLHQGAEHSTFSLLTRNSALAAATGVPAVVQKVGESVEGLPVGMELSGWPGQDSRLLQLGLALEQVWR